MYLALITKILHEQFEIRTGPTFLIWLGPINPHSLCFDYHKVNEVTRSDVFPLPIVQHCMKFRMQSL